MQLPLIIGTRGSDLALWQARYVSSLLKEIDIPSELKIIKTQGDVIQHLSLDKLEGKGFFTKEIEDALLNRETDIAVHSFKDLPTESPAGLIIGAVSMREDPSDLLLIRKEAVDVKKKFSLRQNGIVGTSSARRKSQLLAFRSDIELKDLRGNVPTRVNKLREKHYDAILVAAAGIDRLELDVSEFHVERLSPEEFIPAPAQGVLAIQIRDDDKELLKIIKQLDQPSVRSVVDIERKVLNLFQGGCQMPVGAYAGYDDENEMFHVRVVKSATWDASPVSIYSESKDPHVLAIRVVEKIKSIIPQSVFISRDVSTGYLKEVLIKNDFKVQGWPLIEMKQVAAKNFPNPDWIFFSSKHAVKYFFSQKLEFGKPKFACVGKATSEALRKYGHRADFIGSSTDTKMTGKQFAALAGNSKILFPQAKDSMRSIQNQFVKQDQVFDLIVYETVKRNDQQIPESDIMVFTSPSNVEAYLEKNKLPKNIKVIAMGDATANALRQNNITRAGQCDSFDESGIARAIFSVSSSVQ